jgi:hypothetical protein
LLAILGGGAAHEQRAGQGGGGLLAEDGLFVAEANADGGDDGGATGLLWEHDELETVGEGGADDAGFDVLRGGIEGFALLNCGSAVVILEALGGGGRGGDFGAIGRGGGDEFAEGAVGGFEVGAGDAGDVGGGDPGDLVALEVEEAPVAVACRAAEAEGHGLRVGLRELEVLEDSGLGAVDFVLRGRIGGESFDGLEQGLLGGVDGLIGRELHDGERSAGVVFIVGAHGGGDGLLGIDERLVEAAGLRRAEDLGHDVERRHVGMERGGNVVRRHDALHAPDAAENDGALAFLGGFDGVGRGELALRTRQGAHGGGHCGEGLRLVELAGDDEVGVIGLVVLLVEGG